MRISDEMKNYFDEEVGNIEPNAKVYLFGSRVYDDQKGGDIDIVMLADRRLQFEELSRLRIRFWKKFGEQKLDIVTYTHKDKDPFKDLIMEHAIEL